MTRKPTNPQTDMPPIFTPEEWQTLATIKIQIALSSVAVVAILAYGAYDYWQTPNPLGPIIFGISALIAHSMRPSIPDELRKKLQPPA